MSCAASKSTPLKREPINYLDDIDYFSTDYGDLCCDYDGLCCDEMSCVDCSDNLPGAKNWDHSDCKSSVDCYSKGLAEICCD